LGLLAAATVMAAEPPAAGSDSANADRIAVLVTDWAEAEGFDPLYRKEVVKRSFGPPLQGPDDPCAKYYIGPPNFRQFLGLVPYAVGVKTKGVEAAYDSIGLYRKSADGLYYEAVYDPKVRVAAAEVESQPGLVRPAREVRAPVSRSFWAIDPRDGTNYLEGVYMIGVPTAPPGTKDAPKPMPFPNGIRDADEFSYVAGITDMSILYEDLTPRLSPATVHIESATARMLREMFGAQVDVRTGAYAPTEFQTRFEEDVAIDFAREGFRKMVLVRETTDNNNYANNFMTRGYVDLGLCRAGLDGAFQYQQSRQVGRTPEYNTALLHVAAKNLANIPQGSEVTVLYTTYGLPFPDRVAPGPFSAPHPWSREVYHENAYNNYISFKRYLDAYYGDRYRFVYGPRGSSGEKRLDNYFSYGISTPAEFTSKDPTQRFLTLRQNIDTAKKEGRKEILALLSHWYYNGRDPLLAIRVLQKIPLNTRADFRNGKRWVSWCEKVDSSDPVPCDPNDASLVRLQYSETFDDYAHEFAVGYAHVIRSAVERFGVLPTQFNANIVARGPIDREGGGTVRVTAKGSLRGAALTVARDLHPNEPESFDATNYRAFADPADNLVSAWDSFEAYLGTQDVPLERLAEDGRIASPAVLVGPYRTIVNRPATITLPVALPKGQAQLERLRAFIYNEVAEDWDPVFVPAGSAPLRYDAKTRTASFDTQVFGVFALAIVPPDWTPLKAVRHRYHQSVRPRPLSPWKPAH
jgi:hypothetical protein